MRDVQANASLAAGRGNSLQLLEGGHLAVCSDGTVPTGGVTLYESASISRALRKHLWDVAEDATLATLGFCNVLQVLTGAHLAVGTQNGRVLLFESASVSRAIWESQTGVPPNASLVSEHSVFALQFLHDGHLAAGTSVLMESALRAGGVNLFDSAAISQAMQIPDDEVSANASLAVLGEVSAMVMLDDGSLAVAGWGSEGVLLFESGSVSRAVLQSQQAVPPNASLVARHCYALQVLPGGHLAVGTLGSVLLFESASISRALLGSKQNVTPNASLAADYVTALELLKGGHLAVGTDLSGVLLFEAAGMSRAIRGAMRDVQANASLAARYVKCLQLLEGGHLAVADDSEGVVLLFESSSLSRTLDEAEMQVQANASLAATSAVVSMDAAGGRTSCCWHTGVRRVTL